MIPIIRSLLPYAIGAALALGLPYLFPVLSDNPAIVARAVEVYCDTIMDEDREAFRASVQAQLPPDYEVGIKCGR